MTKLQKAYNNAVNAYVKAFEEKQELQLDFWVGDSVGTIAQFGDYFFSFEDIKTDIDKDAPKWAIIDWYNLLLDGYDYEKDKSKYDYVINYSSYLMGARYDR